jgi:hypothetical protein
MGDRQQVNIGEIDADSLFGMDEHESSCNCNSAITATGK